MVIVGLEMDSYNLVLKNPLSLCVVKDFRYLRWVRHVCQALVIHDAIQEFYSAPLRDLFRCAVEFCDEEHGVFFEDTVIVRYLNYLKSKVNSREIKNKFTPLEVCNRTGIERKVLTQIESNDMSRIYKQATIEKLVAEYQSCWDNSQSYKMVSCLFRHHHNDNALNYFVNRNQQIIDSEIKKWGWV